MRVTTAERWVRAAQRSDELELREQQGPDDGLDRLPLATIREMLAVKLAELEAKGRLAGLLGPGVVDGSVVEAQPD